MVSEEETSLLASLDVYKGQLSQIEACLQTDDSGLERDDLIQLQNDMKELISLTQKALEKSQRSKTLNQNGSSSSLYDESSQSSDQPPDNPSCIASASEINIDEEYAAFQVAMSDHISQEEDDKPAKDVDSDEVDDSLTEDSSSEEDDDNEEEEEMEEENDLFGQRCQAPFSYSWGQSGYHNAIILSRVKNNTNSDEPMVEVVFCNPTHCSMRLCPYYINGNCRFGDSSCRFSHGMNVKISDLKAFQDPDFSKISLGSVCLARDDDEIWYEATIVEILEDAQFQVQFNANHSLKTVSIQDIYPLDHQLEETSKTKDIESDALDEDAAAAHTSYAFPDIKTTDALGNWEQHTKGIGSKLMAKMGYVAGQGLGRNSEGRAEPVPINLLPKGISLDKIMEMKNSTKNENLFSALKKQKRKQNQNKKQKTTDGQKTQSPSVFSFINSKLRQPKENVRSSLKCRGVKTARDTKFISTKELKEKSDKHLNIQILKTNEEIKNTERQIHRLKDSLQRANERGDHTVSDEIRRKLESLAGYKNQLKTSEAFIQNQKTSRKAHNLLTKF